MSRSLTLTGCCMTAHVEARERREACDRTRASRMLLGIAQSRYIYIYIYIFKVHWVDLTEDADRRSTIHNLTYCSQARTEYKISCDLEDGRA